MKMVLARFKAFWFSKSYRAQWKERKEEGDRRRCGKTVSKSGKEWTLSARLGRLKTGQDGNTLFGTHL